MNIYIVGPMGSGKSTVGKIVAQSLFLDFLDSDEEIEKTTGATIDWIFDLEGEKGFRKRETNELEKIVQLNSHVVATGGGIILSDHNRNLLSARGVVIYLETPIKIQVERTSKDKDRPLLKKGNPEKILATKNKSSQEVADQIIDIIKNK
jgi:shikimate kinase